MTGTGSPSPEFRPHRCGIVPPYLLQRLAQLDDPRFAAATEAARHSLLQDTPVREHRALLGEAVKPPVRAAAGRVPGTPHRTISDAARLTRLPGRRVRTEGQPALTDVAANEAYDGLGQTQALFWTVFGRDSINGVGLPLDATVHYGRQYDNAFWDGERMVFGDGDGQVFTRFTVSLSVIAHELTHGVTEFTAALAYEGQSGALNESVSDVFGCLVEQHTRGQNVTEASWLVGEGLFTDQVQGLALRSLRAPGTAYDDDVLGEDPQPDHMSGFIVTDDDNGGVHLNSGIPNRAFYLVAEALGGYAWERAGRIWFDTLTGGLLRRHTDFVSFAEATLTCAADRYGSDSAEWAGVQSAWNRVGVETAAGGNIAA
ncbi:M4 family peptidase [Cryobacterium melibiosiphilum]|uniref:Neutral metalloproteinase n=1 Tax=Cryobacterium melibiosiphilum TaxID=995039 RepID=A0A3A5MJZ4_9MICO|nr:M4 family metallopeptidase [Cryobacterium melibiosiphilum]RJT87358.1 M4 family peptidase [Cryobacterium melibiosiphilum]